MKIGCGSVSWVVFATEKTKILAGVAMEFLQSKHGAVWEPLKCCAWVWSKSK